MRLTRKKAIELCIELWTWLAETGKEKKDWPEWEKYRCIANYCWFCEYAKQREGRYIFRASTCDKCPLQGNAAFRCKEKYYYKQWMNKKQIRTRKKYAKLFLEQIKSLKP